MNRRNLALTVAALAIGNAVPAAGAQTKPGITPVATTTDSTIVTVPMDNGDFDVDTREPLFVYCLKRESNMTGAAKVLVQEVKQTSDGGWRWDAPYWAPAVGAYANFQPKQALALSHDVVTDQ